MVDVFTKNELLQQANEFPAVVVAIRFKVANFDALKLITELNKKEEHCFLLTGSPKDTKSKYTFIGKADDGVIRCRNGLLTQNSKVIEKQPQFFLESLLAKSKTKRSSNLPPFTGGLMGYLAYDYAKYPNKTLNPHGSDPLELDDFSLLYVKNVVAYDHARQEVTLTQIVDSDELVNKLVEVYKQLVRQQAEIVEMLEKSINEDISFKITEPFKLQFSLAEFTEQVEKTRAYIKAGDIFQLILSNPQKARMTGSLLGAAAELFKTSPAPYQFYFHDEQFEALGASPETLVTRTGNKLFTYPLAGTRRRGKNECEDQKFANELQTDSKEQAEHNMLVDLGRNDLGQISRFGTVKVTKLRKLLKFSNVMHLGSTIESESADGVSAIDVVNALMPAGTLSGAPKVRAMQIIDELENNKRGLYGGCLGYFDFNGDLDMCIGIRLAYRKKQALVIHSGAGIVADSISDQEYQEFNNKVRAVKEALLNSSEKRQVVSNAFNNR